MPNVFCVRADFGRFATHFVRGGYAAIGWFDNTDLSTVRSRQELKTLYRDAHPEDKSEIVIGQQVGQIARFLFDIRAGDYVLTPDADTDWLYYGVVGPEPSYFFATAEDGCPYRQRRRVDWVADRLLRSKLSVPLQNTIRAALTVFSVSQVDDFLMGIGKDVERSSLAATKLDRYEVVLRQILQLTAQEFELFVTQLLTAIGFEESQHTGRSGDGGVDATGWLNLANIAKVKVFVQVKRFKSDTKISANTVKQLRQAIPRDCQGAFITTADFRQDAKEVAVESGFPRIGLINGQQLVDLLVRYWNDLPEDLRQKLGLQPGLVLR